MVPLLFMGGFLLILIADEKKGAFSAPVFLLGFLMLFESHIL
jgi:hypothetical protein